MAGTLYLVATPIGNLGDLSPRGADTLAQVDFIAAEDTRVTVKLLNHLGIKKPMVSYHRHSGESRGAELTARLLAGEEVREMWEPAPGLRVYPSKAEAAGQIRLIPLSELAPEALERGE